MLQLKGGVALISNWHVPTVHCTLCLNLLCCEGKLRLSPRHECGCKTCDVKQSTCVGLHVFIDLGDLHILALSWSTNLWPLNSYSMLLKIDQDRRIPKLQRLASGVCIGQETKESCWCLAYMLPSTLLIIVAGGLTQMSILLELSFHQILLEGQTFVHNIHIKLRPQNLHFASCTHCTLLHQELPLAPPPFADSPTTAQWRALGLVDFRQYLWIFLNVHWNNIDLKWFKYLYSNRFNKAKVPVCEISSHFKSII